MSPMKRYKMVCERRLTSTDVCIHPKRSEEDTEDNSELDVTTTATSSESFQYRLKKTHRHKEKCIPESTSSGLLGPSVGDALVHTVEYTGELINFMINGETEMDEDSESKSSEEVEKPLSPGDMAYKQMHLILSPRADDVILGVLDACKYCCMGICKGDEDLLRKTKRKSKSKRRGEIQNWMKMEVSRGKDGQPVDKKGRKHKIRKFELEETFEEEKIKLLEEKCKLEEEKRKILEERMKLMEKKVLLGEEITSSTEESIYKTRGRLGVNEDVTDDKSAETEVKSSSEDQRSGLKERGSFEGRELITDLKISEEMDSKSGSMDSDILRRTSALKADLMEMGKRTSSDRGSKEIGTILGTQETSFETKSAEIEGSPETGSLSNSHRPSTDLGITEESRGNSNRGSQDIERISQKRVSIGSRKSAEVETIPQMLSGGGLETYTETGSFPQATVYPEKISSNGGPTSLATNVIDGSPEHYTLPEINVSTSGKVRSFSSGRGSAEFGVKREMVSGDSPRGTVELRNIPRAERSSGSDRRSDDLGTIIERYGCSCGRKRSTEMESSPEIVKSIGLERSAGDIGAITEKFIDSSVAKRSTEMESVPQKVRSNSSEISEESGTIVERCSCGRKKSSEMESSPEMVDGDSSKRRSGEIRTSTEKFSDSSAGRRPTEMESFPQKVGSNGSERRSGEIRTNTEKFSDSSVGRRSTEMESFPQKVGSNGSERRSGERRAITEKFSDSSAGKRSPEMESFPQKERSSGSERRSGEIRTSTEKFSESSEGKRSTEMESFPQKEGSSGSERRSGEIRTIPKKFSDSSAGRRSTEMESFPQKEGSSGSERRSGEIRTIPEKISDSSAGRRSTEMESFPQKEGSSGSERRSGEVRTIPERISDSSAQRTSTEMESFPQKEGSSGSERRSGEMRTIPEKISDRSAGKRSTEMESFPQKEGSSGSERRSGEMRTIPEKFSDSSAQRTSTEMESFPQKEGSSGSERRSGEIRTIPEKISDSSAGRRSAEMESFLRKVKSDGSETSGEYEINVVRCSCGRKRSYEMESSPEIVKTNGSERISRELGSIRQTASKNGVERSSYSDKKSIDIVPQAVSSTELERKYSEMDENEEEVSMEESESRIPDKERIRELIANYALVRKSVGGFSAPEVLNFSSILQSITPEEFKKLQEEDLRRLKLKRLELQVLEPGEYKEYRGEELLKIGKAIERRRLEWQAIEDKRREEEEELRSLERDIKEKLKAITDGTVDSYIQKKSEEEELEKRIKNLQKEESPSRLSSISSMCSCWKRKLRERKMKKESEKEIGSPRPSKGSRQSQDLNREVEDRKSMGTMEEDTKIESRRESVRSSKENLERRSGELTLSVKSQEGSKSSQGPATSTPIRSSPPSFSISDKVVPKREGAVEYVKSDSVGSTKSGQYTTPSFELDEMCSHPPPKHQLTVSSSDKLGKISYSKEDIVDNAMGEMREDTDQKRISITRPPAPITDREVLVAEDKERIKAKCFESDDSIGYKIDIENVIARERSFTKYKIKEKSSDTLKRSLNTSVPASRTLSNEMDGCDERQIYEKQSSDTHGKSLDAVSSESSNPSVVSSLSRHYSDCDMATIDTNAVQNSPETPRKSFDASISTSRSPTSRDSASNTEKADEELPRGSKVDIGVGTDPVDFAADESRSKTARDSLIDAGVGSSIEYVLISTGVGTNSRDSLASVDEFRKSSAANPRLEVETSSADKIEPIYTPSPANLGKKTDAVSAEVDTRRMTEPDALSDGVKEVKEMPRTDVEVGTDSRINQNGSRREIRMDKEKKMAIPNDSVSPSVTQNRDKSRKMAFTQVDTEETIFTQNMSVGNTSITSRIDVRHTAVRVKNVSVGCGRSVLDLGRAAVNNNSVSVACGSSTTDADSFIDQSQEDNLGHNKRKKLRFVAVTGDELSSKEFKNMKIRALRQCNKTEEPDWSSKRSVRPNKKLDSAAGSDLTHYLQMKKRLDGTIEIPHSHTTKNLRFHIHNSKGDIVGYGKFDNSSISSHKDLRCNPEKVMLMRKTEFDRCNGRHSIPKKKDICTRSMSSSSHSHSPAIEVHRKIPKEKAGASWETGRIDDFDRGKRTVEIDVKKTTEVKTHRGGKCDKEVYVLVPPSRRSSKK